MALVFHNSQNWSLNGLFINKMDEGELNRPLAILCERCCWAMDTKTNQINPKVSLQRLERVFILLSNPVSWTSVWSWQYSLLIITFETLKKQDQRSRVSGPKLISCQKNQLSQISCQKLAGQKISQPKSNLSKNNFLINDLAKKNKLGQRFRGSDLN